METENGGNISESAASIIDAARALIVADPNAAVAKASELIDRADREWAEGRVSLDEYAKIRSAIGTYIAKGVERRCGWPGI